MAGSKLKGGQNIAKQPVIFNITYTPWKIRSNATAEERERFERERPYYEMSDGGNNIDRQAEQLDEDMRGKLLTNARYKRTGNFIEDYRRQTEVNRLIEQEILSELVYVD